MSCYENRSYCDRLTYPLVFKKIDSATRQGLPNAAIEIYVNGCLLASQQSDENGAVIFPMLLPSCYTMLEVAAPQGYLPNHAQYHVVVTNRGDIFINESAAYGFTIENTQEEIQ